jgi:uridine kinase
VNHATASPLDSVRDAILARKKDGRPLIVSVSGVDAAGKTWITTRLAGLLQEAGQRTSVVNVDDFHQAKSLRYASGFDLADQYYYCSYDLRRLVQEILVPIRETGRLDTTLRLLDLATDTFSVDQRYVADPDTVVFLEGVFLLRPELVGFGDMFIEVDLPLFVAFERARNREKDRKDAAATLDKYASKYFAAQVRYRRTFSPVRRAQIVIDNRGETPFTVSLRAEASLDALPDKPLKKDRHYDTVSFGPEVAARPDAEISLRMLQAAGYETEVLSGPAATRSAAAPPGCLHVGESVQLSDLLDELIP